MLGIFQNNCILSNFLKYTNIFSKIPNRLPLIYKICYKKSTIFIFIFSHAVANFRLRTTQTPSEKGVIHILAKQ
jgi:hypothetical protein